MIKWKINHTECVRCLAHYILSVIIVIAAQTLDLVITNILSVMNEDLVITNILSVMNEVTM